MIIDKNPTENVEVFGNVEENKVTIDNKNIDFVVQILSSNLYSSPIESLVREIVTNAWDANKEKGTLDPIIISIKRNEGKDQWYFSVRDFGFGISPERFDKIYRFIGSSTKRETNDQHGGWGLGKFSTLAYTSPVYITTIHERRLYDYMMYKEGMSIKIDKINERPANVDEPDGTNVFLEIKCYSDVGNFYAAVCKQLQFMDNIYLNYDIENDKKFNDRKIIYKNNFAVTSYWERNYVTMLLLGNVVYHYDRDVIFTEDSGLKDIDYDYPFSKIVPIFEIGELQVTPNRESLVYTPATIKVIQDKVRKCVAELDELNKAENTKEIADISDYLSLMVKPHSYIHIIDGDNPIELTINTEFKDNKEIYATPKFGYIDTEEKVRACRKFVDTLVDKVSISSYWVNSKFQFRESRGSYFLDNNDRRVFFKGNLTYNLKQYIKYVYYDKIVSGYPRFWSYKMSTPNWVSFYRLVMYLADSVNEVIFGDKKLLRLLISDILEEYNKVVISDKDIPQSFLDTIKKETVSSSSKVYTNNPAGIRIYSLNLNNKGTGCYTAYGYANYKMDAVKETFVYCKDNSEKDLAVDFGVICTRDDTWMNEDKVIFCTLDDKQISRLKKYNCNVMTFKDYMSSRSGMLKCLFESLYLEDFSWKTKGINLVKSVRSVVKEDVEKELVRIVSSTYTVRYKNEAFECIINYFKENNIDYKPDQDYINIVLKYDAQLKKLLYLATLLQDTYYNIDISDFDSRLISVLVKTFNIFELRDTEENKLNADLSYLNLVNGINKVDTTKAVI